jgi:outer membrane protein assembly factor BamD
MKKIGKIEFNLLIFTILCLFLGEAFASTDAVSFQKNYLNCFEVFNTSPTNTSSIDIKNKKKRDKKQKRSKGKVTFETFRQSYDKAINFYNKKAFLSAARIFEELYPLAIGTPLGDTILFYFADSYFQNNDYQMAAFHFKEYMRRYPGTERTELAALNAVKALYYSSPDYPLDQFTTHYAIDEVNLFIQQYPYSKHIEECNDILDNLRNKLAKKDMEIIRMYFETGNYEAAQIMVRNFLKNYSYSKHTPEVLFILVKNNFDFARRSVENKKYYRYKDCVEAFEKLLTLYPENNFLEESKKIANEAEIQVKKLEEQKK